MVDELEEGGKSNELSARDALLREKLRQRARKSAGAEAGKVPTKPTGPVRLSPYQRPLWVDYRMYPERRTAWIIRGYELDGAVDSDRLLEALEKLNQRHWYLSCAIDNDGRVHPRDAPIPVDVFSASTDPWGEAREYCRSQMPSFRLERGKLFRVALFQGEGRSAIVFSVHHILADHRSIDLLTDELRALFANDVSHISPPPDLMQAYEQQHSALKRDRNELQGFWRNKLDRLPAVKPLPLAKLHADSTRTKGALLRCSADAQLAAVSYAAAKDAGVSAYQWFLTAWSILLGRYYGQDDVHLGTMFSTRRGTRQNDAIGCFQNVVIVRADLDSTQTFSDVLKEMRSVIGRAIAHGTLPLDELARIAPGHSGKGQLFSTLFTLVDAHEQATLLETEVLRAEELDYDGTAFDLTFFVIKSGKELSFAIEFDTGLYEQETLALLFDHFQALLKQMAAAPDAEWRSCSLIESKGLAKLKAEWRRVAATPLPKKRLNDAFFEHTHANPNAVALRWGSGENSEQMTYQNLASRADAVAGFIQSVADPNDTVIAVIGAWQPDTVAAIIGILRSGRAYLPIDADYPDSRTSHILRDAGMPLVLVQTGAKVPDGSSDRCYSIADAMEAGLTSGPVIDNPLAYVIYTSGSSGAPKGVRISHGAAVYSTAERSRIYAEWPPGIFLLLSSFSFDSAVAGLWWTLSTGGCLRLADRQTVRAADAIAELIESERITHTLCLPSQWSDICRITQSPLESMELVVVAGEACAASTIEHHIKRAPDAALFNEYGPTEMTVWSTCHHLKKGDADPVSIGRPLIGTQALVMDEFGNVVPDGLSGQLVLAGHGIAEGYMGNVSGGFTAHPLDPGSRAYRTGDRVRRGADGLLYFEGRVDEQVKYRGYRIGIESIEQALGSVAGEVAIIPWDGISLEDLLAELPNDEAHALVDERLKQTDDSAQLWQKFVTKDDQFQIEIALDSSFISTPRPAQRAWLLRKTMAEFAEDLRAHDHIAGRFVRGLERVQTEDFKTQALSALTDAAIMEDWQIPIMRAMAGIVGRHGGDVLEVGFGRGVSAEFVQGYEVESHTIIESEKAVVERYFRPWREKHAIARISLELKKWQDCKLKAQSFDGILFHAYPLDESEFFEHIVQSVTYAEHAIPAMAELLRPGGRFTYLSNEIDSLSRMHQRLLFRHFNQIRTEVIDIEVPDDTKDAWWAPKMVIVEAIR